MKDCERNYSMWTFSGGFRTWVKMSLVRTSGRGNESVEFRQEVGECFLLRYKQSTLSYWYLINNVILQSSVVKYNDRRPPQEQTNELFFVVFQWRDPFIQQVKDVGEGRFSCTHNVSSKYLFIKIYLLNALLLIIMLHFNAAW